jgi:hypothetical protein
MAHVPPLARAVLALASLVGLGLSACDSAPDPLAPAAMDVASAKVSAKSAGASINQQLAALRRLTAPFHNFEKAEAAGWGTELTPCLEISLGAQGFHYANLGYIDGEVDLLKPELLQYEPQADGKLRLVGVEYIVPLSAWTSAEPPTLLGQEFHVNPVFQVWALHVWLWRANPSGMFADWNPKVSCAGAS